MDFKGQYQRGHLFDISYLEEGYYLVRILNNEGNTEIKKLVKH